MDGNFGITFEWNNPFKWMSSVYACLLRNTKRNVGGKRSQWGQLKSEIILFSPPEERLRGHRVTQVRDRRPPNIQTAPLLSANGTEEEGVTKARALGVIRKGLVSCFGSDRTVGVLCKRPSKSQVVLHKQSGFSQIQNVVMCFMCSHFKTENEQNKRCRNRGSGGVQGRFFTSPITLQENQIASGSRHPPLHSS